MEQGTLKLKAGGWGWRPSAVLKFNIDVIASDWYKPFIGAFGVGGKTFDASRCNHCSHIFFKYQN